VSKAAWRGAALAITTTHRFEATTSEMTQVLSLEAPTTLVIETTRPGVLGGDASTARTIYRKREGKP
jgi:hypothetical protein